MGELNDVSDGAGDPPALLRIRGMLATQRDLPATSYAPRRLGIAAANPEIRVQALAELAMCDPAIMVRLLRMANSSTYATRDTNDVVSVRRAIALMGHDQVRNDAYQLPPLADRIPAGHQAMVRAETAQTVFAVQLVRNLLDSRNPLVTDEGATTVVVGRLATIVTAIQAPHEVCALRWVKRHHAKILDACNRELFGASDSQMVHEIVQAWSLPRSVLATLGKASQRPYPVEHARDWLPLAVGLAMEVAATTRIESRARRDDVLMEIVRRYARALDIDGPRLDSLITESGEQAARLERALGCGKAELAIGPLLEPLLARTDKVEPWWEPMERMDITGLITRLTNRIAEPVFEVNGIVPPKAANASAQLSALGDEMAAVIETYSSTESDRYFNRADETPWDRIAARIAPQLLAGMKRVLRFDRVMLFLDENQDGTCEQVAASPAPGPVDVRMRAELGKSDLLGAAMKGRADLHIVDCATRKIHSRLPEWFVQRLDNARGFVFLPIASPQLSAGFILAIWNRIEPDGVSKAELAQLRRIRDGLRGVLERFAPGWEDRAAQQEPRPGRTVQPGPVSIS